MLYPEKEILFLKLARDILNRSVGSFAIVFFRKAPFYEDPDFKR
jgi:hypothetical protein